MTDKVQKIREEVERRLWLLVPKMTFQHQRKELENILSFIDSMQEEPVSEFLNTESMIESYKQRLISQANGVKNSHLIDMCLASYKHGINETLDTLNLFNVQSSGKNWKEEPVSEGLEEEIGRLFNKYKLKIERLRRLRDIDSPKFTDFKFGKCYGAYQILGTLLGFKNK